MNQKIENVLALALQSPDSVREKSLYLNVGFTEETRTWELIVKYNGNLSKAGSGLAVTAEELIAEELIAGYGLLTVPEDLVDTVSRLPEIEYVEKPKRLFFSMADGKEDSCVLPVTKRQPFLSGKGILQTSGMRTAAPEFYHSGTRRFPRMRKKDFSRRKDL